MRYDFDKKMVREILKSVDIYNTLNGGRVAPQVSVATRKDHLLLTVRVPGVAVAELEVNILNGILQVTRPMNLKMDHERSIVPDVIASMPIAAGIDYHNITACQAGDRLEIILPFNDLARGYNRPIKITN